MVHAPARLNMSLSLRSYMTLRLYNTLGREKQVFEPLEGSTARMYACGPTVYHYAHLGNLRAYVFMDVLRRVIEYVGYDVDLIINITDVGHLTDDADQGEDKMEKGAKREGKSVWDIAAYYTEAFMQDIDALNIKRPRKWTKATDYIQEQIDLVKKIEANGFTYRTDDGIYFDTSKLDNYGVLVPNFDPEALQAGKRVEMGDKKHATDFALWKFSSPGESRQMEWDSPWGVGFPGWHVECTAMGCSELGEVFDIHTGGQDHISVHHTNEIAQAKGAFGTNHARFWMHNEFLVDKSGKMSKSKGDFLRLQSVQEKGFDPLDYRYFCLLTHYRKPLSFSWEALEAARSARLRVTEKVVSLKEEVSGLGSGKPSSMQLALQKRFSEAISDDLNTADALALVQEVLKSELSASQKLSLLLDWDAVLGLRFSQAAKQVVDAPQEVVALADKRLVARQEKDFSRADALREEIASLGWVVEDTSADSYELSPAR